jgi:hypothetical protein
MPKNGKQPESTADQKAMLECGIVMPISSIDGLNEQH